MEGFSFVNVMAGSGGVLLILVVFLATRRRISLIDDSPNLAVPTVLLGILSLLSLKVSMAGMIIASLFLLMKKEKQES